MRSMLPRLSKTRFQAGLQCHTCLWLDCHAPELADPVTETTQALFNQGHEVGALARELFAGGVLVAEDHRQSDRAIATTRRLIDGGVRCLYEGAFLHEGVLVRADILFKDADGGWVLTEVKSSASVKPEHVSDLAIQTYVLRGAGLPVTGARLLHLDTGYVYQGGAYDLGGLFSSADLTTDVEAFVPQIPGLLQGMRRMLGGPMPEPPISKRCDSPYTCRYRGYCHSSLPEYPVTELPRISDELLQSLLANGYRSQTDVPLDYPGLSGAQRRACYLARTGEMRIGPGLAPALSGLREPIHFLDFETWSPALPVHAGTRPYQALPVQWSCHTLDGRLRHADYLHTARADPRRAFAESLLAHLGEQTGAAGRGPIVVYTGYEERILKSLAADLPDLYRPIAALMSRLFDLHAVVRDQVQHPGFRGSYSLKHVLPALVDDVSYQGLAVADGETAQLRWAEAVHDEPGEAVRQRIFADLRTYCATDTLGLVRLYQELAARCG